VELFELQPCTSSTHRLHIFLYLHGA
jgi:hypothetical protein